MTDGSRNPTTALEYWFRASYMFAFVACNYWVVPYFNHGQPLSPADWLKMGIVWAAMDAIRAIFQHTKGNHV